MVNFKCIPGLTSLPEQIGVGGATNRHTLSGIRLSTNRLMKMTDYQAAGDNESLRIDDLLL